MNKLTGHKEAITTTPRIAYFDLAKGVCILLVVWYHLRELFDMHSALDAYTNAVRMPLYFFLSGFFFKTYGDFLVFLQKKTKKLLIPFLFFYLLTSVCLPIAAYHLVGMEFATGHDWHLLYAFLTYNDYPNIPLWFLWGLFILNITFFALHRMTTNKWALGIICLIISIVLGNMCHLPASLNSAYNGMIFFFIGYVAFQKQIITRMNTKLALPLLLCAFIILGLFTSDFTGIEITRNILMSTAGVVALVLICRIVNHLPYVSYVGRYSIMLLVTHEPLIRALQTIHISNIYICFVIIALSYLAIIPFMRKFMPHVTAQ